MTAHRMILALAAAALLAACGDSGGQAGPGGVTANEAQALDDAAEMIDERRLKPEEAEGEQAAEGESDQ